MLVLCSSQDPPTISHRPAATLRDAHSALPGDYLSIRKTAKPDLKQTSLPRDKAAATPLGCSAGSLSGRSGGALLRLRAATGLLMRNNDLAEMPGAGDMAICVPRFNFLAARRCSELSAEFYQFESVRRWA